jgi:hypothetical protein
MAEHAVVIPRSRNWEFAALGWLVEQVAHNLPADCGIACKEQIDHGLVARHLGR